MEIKSIVLLLSTLCTFNMLVQCVENPNNHYYAVILAGGSGERLWPLSRQEKPKQLLSVAQDGTLLDQAIDRVINYIPKKNIWVSTTTKYTKIIQEYVGNRVGIISAEPSSRNTGPAILLTCMKIAQQDPEAVILFVPADPFIPAAQYQSFQQSVQHVLKFATEHNSIVLLGVNPTYPATGYGYIEYDKNTINGSNCHSVVSFKEKPSYEVANEYLQKGCMLWNIGMFCAQATVFIDEFKRLAPVVYETVAAYIGGMGTYEQAPSISIDYAVIEKSNVTAVLPIDLTWYDVGNLQVFLSLKNQFEGLKTQLVSVDANNNLVDAPDLLVALVGVSDLCINKTGNILVIAHEKATEKIRSVVEQLKKEHQANYL